MTKAFKKKTRETRQIEEKIQAAGYTKVKAYRQNWASIRVRVIDEKFRGKSRVVREEMLTPVIRTLPEKIQADITMLLLITPTEVKTSLASLEFEHPTPSLL
jgi:stress-induced morphogen